MASRMKLPKPILVYAQIGHNTGIIVVNVVVVVGVTIVVNVAHVVTIIIVRRAQPPPTAVAVFNFFLSVIFTGLQSAYLSVLLRHVT